MKKKSDISPSEYAQIHYWLKVNFGLAKMCENPKCPKTSKVFNWAKIRGKDYAKNRKNFKQLCRICHSKYDFTEEMREKCRNNTNRQKRTCIEGHLLDGENMIIYKSNRIGGSQRKCVACAKERNRRWRAKNKASIKISNHKYHAKRKLLLNNLMK